MSGEDSPHNAVNDEQENDDKQDEQSEEPTGKRIHAHTNTRACTHKDR